MLAGLVLLAAVAAVGASSSSSTCIPTVYTVPVPSTIQQSISSALTSDPSMYSMGEMISILEFATPSIEPAISGLEYYEQQYSTVISEMMSLYEYPSLYTDLTAVEEITSAYPTLAGDVSSVVSATVSHSLTAVYIPVLLSAAVSYPSILTDLDDAIDISYPAVASASQVVTEATLISSSIFGSVAAVTTAVTVSSTASYAVAYLSSAVYSLPTTVVTEIITIISSPSTVGSSTVSSLEQCYSTVYDYVEEVTSFTYSYPSIVNDVTAFLSVASTVSSLSSAVNTILYYESPTFLYEASVFASAVSSSPILSEALPVLTGYMALSPTLSQAEYTIEQSFYNSPYTASSIYDALVSPSTVTSPSAISAYEATHESLVTALEDVISFEAYYTSIASTLENVESEVTSAFADYRTLITAYSFGQALTSVSYEEATIAVSSAKQIESDITYVLYGLASVISSVPSLSCAESLIEYYADIYPSTVEYLWSIYDGYLSVPSSSITYVATLIASYPSLDSAMSDVVSYYDSYPSLFSLESSLIYAASTDSTLLSDFETMSSSSSMAYDFWSASWSS